MLEGLEISEVLLSECKDDNYECRIDSEYYQKKYISIEQTVEKKGFNLLSYISLKVSDGTHFTPKYVEMGIPFLSALNVKENYLDFNNNYQYITLEEHNLLYKRCNPEKNDVLLRKVGVGARYACVVPMNLPDFSIFVSVALIKCSKKINPHFLACFINTKFGQEQLLRLNKGISQPDLHLEDIRRLKIPIVPTDFQNKIEEVVKLAHSKREQSQTLYHQAEELLLETIGLKNFTPSQEKTNIKTFKESFLEIGRLDAEYYQPKYEEIIDVVKKFKNGSANFEVFIDSYSTGYPYKSETYIEQNGIPLVRINNLTKEGLDLSNAIHIPKEDLNLSKKDIAKENDILISMSGTIGLSCIVREKNEIVINQRIMKITSKNYNPQVLSLLLNSIVGKYQLERIGTGGVQTNISSTDIKNILIPIIDLPIQQQISALIQESFALRKESESLLAEAKEIVEREIEKRT